MRQMGKMAMSDLPKGWIKSKLGDIVHIKYGKDLSTKKILSKGKYPVFGANSIIGYYDEYLYETEQVLISCRGANSGKINFSPPKCFVTHNSLVLEFGKDFFAAKKYLFYALQAVGKSTIITGSAQPQVTINNAVNLEISLASLNEQRRIVAKLEKLLHRVDACKERLNKIPAILKRFRQSVLAAACSGRLTEDWRKKNPDVEPSRVLLEKIKNNRLASVQTKNERNKIIKFYDEGKERLKQKDNEVDLPETWAFCEINNLGDVCNGSTPSRKKSEYWSGNIPWISSGEVRNNVITETREAITEEGYKNSSVRLLPVGTVLLAMIGEGKTRGQTAILNIEATINQNIAAIILNHGLISSKYLWYWFQLQYEITRQVGSGSGPQALNCQRVRELPFHLPPLPEQHEIVRRVNALFKKADEIEVRYKKAKAFVDKMTQSILAKAFRGELVPQDPNDEPASVLLEKIKVERAKQEPKRKKVAHDA